MHVIYVSLSQEQEEGRVDDRGGRGRGTFVGRRVKHVLGFGLLVD